MTVFRLLSYVAALAGGLATGFVVSAADITGVAMYVTYFGATSLIVLVLCTIEVLKSENWA